MESTKTTKQPLLTWKSFLISFAIILFIYLIASGLTKENKKEEKEANFFSSNESYDYTVVNGDEAAGNSILAIPLHGVILTEQSSDFGFFDFLGEEGVVYGYDIKEQIKRAAENPEIKGIVLEINSPGGTIPGSLAIADGVAYYKEVTGNPVYAHISDVGASGGYWSAASTDYIVADSGSTVGSIGVIMGPFKQYKNVVGESNFLGGVETEGGIENRYFSAGQFKDTGSPYRALAPEEEKHWQTSLDNEYRKFVNYVSVRRDIAPEKIVGTIKAFPYETQRAIELNLIDEIGSKESTYNMMAKEKNMEDYNIIKEESDFGVFGDLFKGASMLAPNKKAGSCSWCNAPLVLYDRSYSIR